MIRELLALPFVFILSWVVTVVGWMGKLVNPTPAFRLLFDWLIGFGKAEQMSDEHADALVDSVAAWEIEYDVSKQVLIEQARENHRRSISRISRGESVLSISIALIAVLVKQVPSTVPLPLGLSLSLPSVNTILLVLTVVLVISVFFRETAVEAQVFSSPTVFDTYDELMTKLAWNGGTLSESRVSYNLLVLQILREWDERFYHLYLRMISDFIEEKGFSKHEALKKYLPIAMDLIEEKYGS